MVLILCFDAVLGSLAGIRWTAVSVGLQRPRRVPRRPMGAHSAFEGLGRGLQSVEDGKREAATRPGTGVAAPGSGSVVTRGKRNARSRLGHPLYTCTHTHRRLSSNLVSSVSSFQYQLMSSRYFMRFPEAYDVFLVCHDMSSHVMAAEREVAKVLGMRAAPLTPSPFEVLNAW